MEKIPHSREEAMSTYLFRISTKKSNVLSDKNPYPVYYVTESKEKATKWANENLQIGLSVSKVTCLAEQIGGAVFVATTR